MQSIKAINPDAVIRKVFLTPIIGTHLGPDSVVLCYVKKSPEKTKWFYPPQRTNVPRRFIMRVAGFTLHKVGTVYVRPNFSAGVAPVAKSNFLYNLCAFFIGIQAIGGAVNSLFYKTNGKRNGCGLCVKNESAETIRIHFPYLAYYFLFIQL